MTGELITFKDLLDSTVTVDGVELEATIETVVRRTSSGACFIESSDVGDIYINANGNLILLDQESFKTRNKTLRDRFINACELLALTKARDAADHEFDELEEYSA